MKLYRSIKELSELKKPTFLAIGVFDGVHPGHRAVIQNALDQAAEQDGNAVVVTFDPHPQRVLHPQDAPRLLTSTHHKIALLREMEVQTLLVINFTPEFAATEPETFIGQLCEVCPKLRGITVGHEWAFGRACRGNLDLLRALGKKFGFAVTGIPPVSIGGETVSSTLIRRAIEENKLQRASDLLARPFSILGRVEHGSHLGRELGFPTANLTTGSEQFPPDGVYTVIAWHEGQVLPGVVNIGIRPTLENPAPQRLLELHLIDYEGELYGEEIEVVFRDRLRDEIKFPNLDALKKQIAKDVKQARKLLTDCGELAWSG